MCQSAHIIPIRAQNTLGAAHLLLAKGVERLESNQIFALKFTRPKAIICMHLHDKL